MKPIDLSAYANRTVDFLIDNKLIKVPEMSHKQYKKVVDYENNSDTTLDMQRALVLELLNTNTSGVKFSDKDILGMPQGAVNRLYTEMASLPRKALTDPN